MKLLTEDLIAKFPPLHSTDDQEPADVPVIAKYFHPVGGYTFYATEASAELPDGSYVALKDAPAGSDLNSRAGVDDVHFFGLVRWHETELGYVSLSELQSATVLGLGMERDLYFDNHSLADVQANRL